MSGDVQPRKRKDRKRKKDELGLEEPRGTAAALGEGDVFMHSPHEHGTGGHWCAKIIFFSLLAILITLIGLIILENRGLTELEANAVESRYSGVLQGWIEDDNHHDEHTLDLKHHDDDDGEIDQNENNLSNEIEHDTEDINDEADNQINEEDDDEESDLNEDDEDNDLNEDDDEEGSNLNEDDDEEDNNHNRDGEDNKEDDEEEGEQDNDDGNASEEDSELNEFDNVNYKGSLEDDDSKEHVISYKTNTKSVEEKDEDEFETNTNNDYFESNEYDEDDDNEKKRKLNDNEEENDDQSKQVEDIKNDDSENDRKESSDEDLEDRDQYENEDSNYKNVIRHIRRDIENDEDFVMDDRDSDVELEKIEKEYSDEELVQPVIEEHVTPIKRGLREQENSNENISEEDEDDKEFLAPEDIEESPVVESITAPRGKPLIELEDETSSEKPPNTLAEEEEYEKQQEELSRQKEQASHMWLKVLVGGALVVATHAVLRRATAPRDTLASEEQFIREETPSLIDRRMTLILEETLPVNSNLTVETSQPSIPDAMEHISFLTNTTPILNQEIQEKEESPMEFTPVEMTKEEEEDKELYSEEDDEDVQEEIFEEKTEPTKLSITETKTELAPEFDQEDVSDDVEIIDDEQLEEELIDEDEEEISDVDDSELLRRLEAKYGRLPEPERPGTKPKDGGNNIEDEWPGEPSEAYWRQYLDQAEQDLQQEWRD